MRYIDERCKDCDEYLEPYGCRNHDCPICQDYEEGMAEIETDNDRRDNRIAPVFTGILNTIRGEI